LDMEHVVEDHTGLSKTVLEPAGVWVATSVWQGTATTTVESLPMFHIQSSDHRRTSPVRFRNPLKAYKKVMNRPSLDIAMQSA
jgi:hypothetical protein